MKTAVILCFDFDVDHPADAANEAKYFGNFLTSSVEQVLEDESLADSGHTIEDYSYIIAYDEIGFWDRVREAFRHVTRGIGPSRPAPSDS